jgi:hypothetical protein
MGNEKKKGKKLCPPSTVVPDSVPTVVVVEKVAKESSKNEIDAIFGGKKRKKEVGTAGSGEDQKSGAAAAGAAENENSDVKEVLSRKKKKTKTKKTAGKSLELVEKSSGLSRKKTDDGLPVYSEAELGFNKKEAGGTPLCPFDCECCF